MPPEQCPACRRFLKRAFVEGLAEAPAPCPRCGTELSGASFATVGIDVVTTTGDVSPTGAPPAAPSVRPPDLPPSDVRDEPDPLAGWDAGLPSGSAVIRDERPFPADTVAVAAATVAGAALGAVLGQRPVRDAVFGALGGAVGAGVARRIWELP